MQNEKARKYLFFLSFSLCHSGICFFNFVEVGKPPGLLPLPCAHTPQRKKAPISMPTKDTAAGSKDARPSSQGSLAGFFKPKPAAATPTDAPAGSKRSSEIDSAPAPKKHASVLGSAGASDSSPATDTSRKEPQTSRVDTMQVEQTPLHPPSALSRRQVADDDDDEEDVPLAARQRPVATPASSAATSSVAPATGASGATDDVAEAVREYNLRPATAEDAAAAYAAASQQHRSPGAPAAGGVTKEVSFQFLRDRRDAGGRRPGEPGFDKTTIQVKLRGSEKLTPGQEQYWEIKRHHADCIVAFKMGKFYELFEEDALIGHRELDLAFMGKGAPHAGFPEAALPKYAALPTRSSLDATRRALCPPHPIFP